LLDLTGKVLFSSNKVVKSEKFDLTGRVDGICLVMTQVENDIYNRK